VCRLFGLHAGRQSVSATFWLLDAPDSLSAQSHRNPDGAGIGRFDGSQLPVVDKQPLAAWHDPAFARAARTLNGVTFVAHVRYASTGALTHANTHPFEQDGRLFAHNGVVEGLPALDARLEELGASRLVQGDTDSERVFALITAETRRRDGDLRAGLTAATRWIAEELPVYSLNLIVLTATELLALRYPDTNELYVLARKAGGPGGAAHLDATTSRIHARSSDLAAAPSVVIASEPMDDDDWRPLASGELLHVDADLAIHASHPLPNAPRHALTLRDLNPAAAGSQRPLHGQ
jgi:predicted glutamine amidotransferase